MASNLIAVSMFIHLIVMLILHLRAPRQVLIGNKHCSFCTACPNIDCKPTHLDAKRLSCPTHWAIVAKRRTNRFFGILKSPTRPEVLQASSSCAVTLSKIASLEMRPQPPVSLKLSRSRLKHVKHI